MTTTISPPPLFGVAITPAASALDEVVAMARAADEAGLDLLGLQDHPYSPAFVDTMSLLAALAPLTRRIRLFPDVANLPLRSAAMLAKAATTIDLLSGGRFELGLGSGAALPAVHAYGGPALAPASALAAFTEGVEVIRAIWNPDVPAHAGGEHHAVRGARGGPPPEHRIGIWVGSVGPRMLALTGRIGDGWAAPIPKYLPFERLRDAQERIDEAAASAGRSPRDVLRIQQIPGAIATRDGGPPRGDAPLVGPPERWIHELTRSALDLRFDAFVLWPIQSGKHQVRAFAELVAPAVREAVGRGCGSSARGVHA